MPWSSRTTVTFEPSPGTAMVPDVCGKLRRTTTTPAIIAATSTSTTTTATYDAQRAGPGHDRKPVRGEPARLPRAEAEVGADTAAIVPEVRGKFTDRPRVVIISSRHRRVPGDEDRIPRTGDGVRGGQGAHLPVRLHGMCALLR